MIVTIVAMVPTIALLPSLMFPLSLCFFFMCTEIFHDVQKFISKGQHKLRPLNLDQLPQSVIFTLNSTFFQLA